MQGEPFCLYPAGAARLISMPGGVNGGFVREVRLCESTELAEDCGDEAHPIRQPVQSPIEARDINASGQIVRCSEHADGARDDFGSIWLPQQRSG